MRNTDIMEALGDVPEDLVMNALSSADDLTAFPAEREHIMMTENKDTKSRRRLWLRGGIAAAAVIVLIAGNLALLYSLGKIGRGGSSQAPLTGTEAETTGTDADTTESTAETTDATLPIYDEPDIPDGLHYADQVVVPNLIGMSYEEAVKTANACGFPYVEMVSVNDTTPARTVTWQDPDPDVLSYNLNYITLHVSNGIPDTKLAFELRETGYCVVNLYGYPEVTIPSKYKGLPVTEIDCRDRSVNTVSIPDSVTKIKDGAFPDDTILRGNAGSYAEAYAKQHQLSFISNSTIRCGGYHYRTADNSLYRTEDNKKLFTVEHPEQYYHRKPALDTDSIVIGFDEITNAGDGWYFLCGTAEDPLNACLSTQYYPNSDYFYLWFNEHTGELKQAVCSEEERELIHTAYLENGGFAYRWNGVLTYTTAIYPDPDGGAVYTCIKRSVVRIPVPGNGGISIIYSPDDLLGYDIDGYPFAPLRGGKILWNREADTDGLFEVDPAEKSCRCLTDQYDPYDIVYAGNRYICLVYDYDYPPDGQKLLEYLPESNSFRLVAAIEELDDFYRIGGFTDDSVVLFHDPDREGAPDLRVSLKDGKITKITTE